MTAAAQGSRIATLDAVRGVAVMGILFMNIFAFALPEAAYMNPAAYGGASGADLATWLVDFILFDGKMRGLFSFLFGASILLVIDRAEAKGEPAARVHFARMAWLFAFGFAHLALLWWGDILHHYALVGCLAWLFRRQPPYKLIVAAIILLLIEFCFVGLVTAAVARSEAAAHAPHVSAEALRTYANYVHNFGIPPAADIARDLALHRGSYAQIVTHRWPQALAIPVQTFTFLAMETLGYMLLGMAALRSGLLTGAWPRRRYRQLAAIGFGIGIPAYALIALIPLTSGFGIGSVALAELLLAAPVRPLMIGGWAALIMLLLRPHGGLTRRVAAAGRMAFSNYLGTSLICTTLFYGYGFGLYGHLSRFALTGVVLLVCGLMLLWSAPWLARFRYGPLEWLWRSLARGRVQPFAGAAA